MGSLLVMVGGFVQAAGPESPAAIPQYANNQELVKPANYREWVFLSSGLGMNYSPKAGGHDMFTNVFVPQWAYQEFVKSGKWPDKTIFVVEERGAQSRASINQHGHY